MIDKDHIQAQARSYARQYATLQEACPYPFTSEAGWVFKEAFLAARADMQAACAAAPERPVKAACASNTGKTQWLLMNTGREHQLLSHRESALDQSTPYVPALGEIAHSLAHINRFTGHARRAYSVAEHSLLVADMVAHDGHGYVAEICALMHDAHESITGDVATPIKQVLGGAWARFEQVQQNMVLRAYGLVDAMQDHATLIKHYDLKALATERRDLLPFDAATSTPWPIIDTPGAEIQPWAGVELLGKERVCKTPAAWATTWTWRTATLIAIVLERMEATAKEAA